MTLALVVLLAYLIGSVSFAVVVSKVLGLPDPHAYGSGNPGATNVLRTGHKGAAALTLTGDTLKGWLAVWLAHRLLAGEPAADSGVALAGLAVFVGHLFPVFHRFAGGKGVATAAGVMFALSPWVGLAALVVWLAFAGLFRIASLASLAAAATAPLFAWVLLGNGPRAWTLVAMAALLAWRHRGNIEKLRAGTETRIGR